MRQVVVMLGLLGCDPDPEPLCWDEGPNLTIVTADGSRVPFKDGDPIELVHGAQGGWHIEVGGGVTETERLVQFDLMVTHEELRVAHGRYSVGLADYGVAGCSGYRDNMLGIFNWRALPNPDDLRPSELMDGLPIRVDLKVTSASGAVDEQHVNLVVDWPDKE